MCFIMWFGTVLKGSCKNQMHIQRFSDVKIYEQNKPGANRSIFCHLFS